MDYEIVDFEGNTITVNINNDSSIENTLEKESSFWNHEIIRSFSLTFSSSPIFYRNPEYSEEFNLWCVVVDRLDIAMQQLNKIKEPLAKENDLITFMMYACMVVDGVKLIFENIRKKEGDQNLYAVQEPYRYFGEIYRHSPVYNPQKSDPTDDKFFEYFRALVFAHPFKTDRPSFFHSKEIQYSPHPYLSDLKPNIVGAVIYTNISPEILLLEFPFSTLKEYVKSRYERLELATQWIKDKIKATHEEWKNERINRDLQPIEILKEIKRILTNRSEDIYDIDELISYLQCDLSIATNEPNVELYRAAIIKSIPTLCDAIENVDNEILCDTIEKLLHCRPAKMHPNAHYQLGKIYCDLDDRDHAYGAESWARDQLFLFSQKFAKKWVEFNVDDMSKQEIRLLTSTACYLECLEQGK